MFSRDLLEPSINLGSGASTAPSALEPTPSVEALLAGDEVMEIEGSSSQSSRSLDWHTPLLDCLI